MSISPSSTGPSPARLDPKALRGRTAVVTGASSGIGAAFARALAARGADLVVVARRTDRLQALADELSPTGVRVHIRTADLGRPGAAAELANSLAADGIPVDLLVNNAGLGLPHGRFDEADPERLRELINVNVMAVAELAHALLPVIRQRRGAIINMASSVSFLPTPYHTAYGAAKAFVLSLSEALWAENRDSGVRVLAVCPGRTITEFFEASGPQANTGSAQTAEEVVAQALTALEGERPTIVTGWRNFLTAQLPRLLPRRMVVSIAERLGRTPVAPSELVKA
ncbi:SDR family NAD(P)-dependent oxidoreductase [Micromonospora sp. CA-259024]|uniref:SDR family NAD(P)-dependent oxidoreductase n=1 Tax=Micromonospora sp. CA-259024 TaxID=3239965 RepID=UPI003D8DC30A